MLYNVAQLLKEGIGASREHEFCGDLYDLDEHNPGPVQVQGYVSMVRIPRGILVTGQAHVTVRSTCRRCLKLGESELAFDIEEEYIPSIDIVTGAHLPLTDDDEPELVIDEQHTLDLTEVIRQYLVAETTGHGLCQPECKGLCPMCGRDLNDGPCGCEPNEIDSRLAGLAALLQDDGATKNE